MWALKTAWYMMGIQFIHSQHEMAGLTPEKNLPKEILLAIIYPSIFWIILTIFVIAMTYFIDSIFEDSKPEKID